MHLKKQAWTYHHSLTLKTNTIEAPFHLPSLFTTHIV